MTTNNKLRVLMAATIYASMRDRDPLDGLSAVMRDAIKEADELLELAAGTPTNPEEEPEQPAAGDPFFVIHRETCKAISSPGDTPPLPWQWCNVSGREVNTAIEQIDAGMFSGDVFQSLEAIRYLEHFIGRWVRELKLTRDSLGDEAKQPGVAPPRHYPAAYPKKCGICYSTEHDSDTCQEDIPF